MEGQRVYPNKFGKLRLPEGGYGRDLRGRWMARPPRGNLVGLKLECVLEHSDGTVTVIGEILNGVTYLLENGNWRRI